MRGKAITKEQQNLIIKYIKEGFNYAEISKMTGIQRQTINAWCSRNGYISNNAKTNRRYVWTDESKEKFIKMYNLIDLGIYVYTFEDIMKEFDIKDRTTITNTAKRFGLSPRDLKCYNKKSGLNYEQRKKVLIDCESLTLPELSEKYNVNRQTIVDFLESQNINPIRTKSKYDALIKLNPNFKTDFENLTLSHKYVALKYDLYPSTIKRWRFDVFGKEINNISKTRKKTTPELQFEDILYKLEIPFFYEWSIDKWSIDYYLGWKICIEINGDYWHSNTEYVIEKDKEKEKWLLDNGYKLYIFTENDLMENKSFVVNKIKEIVAMLDRNI